MTRDEAIGRRILWILMAIGAATLVAAAALGADPAAAKKAAEESAKSWLALVDGGAYDESWSAAATMFRNATSQAKWRAAIAGARGSFGKLVSRKLQSARYTRTLPGAPDGEYVVLRYVASFEHKKEALETVTPMKDDDGVWRVSGYFVR